MPILASTLNEQDLERFWAKVHKTEGCWEWNGYRRHLGYGAFTRRGKTSAVHRITYELTHGPIPEGLFIDHICHNPPCVNPDHLRPVTPKQNQENLTSTRRASSGVRGVTYRAEKKKWQAAVTHNRKYHYVGIFEKLEDAEAAVIAKRNELFTHNDMDRKAS